MKTPEVIRKAVSVAVAGVMLICGAPLAGGGPAFAKSSSAPAFQLAKNGGGAYTDAYQHVAYTNDGGFVVGGYTMGASESPKWEYYQDKHANNHGVLVKYSKDKTIEWSRSFGEKSGVVVFNDMEVLKDGRIAAIGRKSASDIPKVNGNDVIKGVSWYIVVVDPQDPGQYTEYMIGGTAGDQGYGVTALPDGGFAVTGWVASADGYWTSRTVSGEENGDFADPQQLWQKNGGTIEGMPSRSKYRDTVVVRFNADNTVKWTTVNNVGIAENLVVAGASAAETTESITSDERGDIVISGSGQLAKNVNNATIVKIEGSSGKILWERSAGRTAPKAAPEDSADYMSAVYTNVTALKDGSYVVVGEAKQDADTEEGWQTTSQKDYIIVHYAADGTLIHTESFGRAGDSNSRPEGVTATPDGGYIVNGSQSGILYEDDLIRRGYDWGNYGAQDAILCKYDRNDQLEWAKNYGTTGGDWFNAVAADDDGELIVVGESNGSGGNPAWGNHGGIDGIVLVSDGSSAGSSAASGIVADGSVIWADGTYEGRGTGYGVINATSKNDGLMTMQVVIEDHRIVSVTCTSNLETPAYYKSVARRLFPQFVQKQGTEVDIVSGATMTSNGAIEGVNKALGKAASAHVDTLIEAIAAAETDEAKKAKTQEAVEAYGQLGTYAQDALEQLDVLISAAEVYGVTMSTKTDAQTINEIRPQLAGTLVHDDRYYKIQDIYYNNIHADGLRDHGYTGAGVKIAVVDSGITGGHSDLDYSRILDGWDYGDGKDYNEETKPGSAMTAAELYDNNGHGTAVAGILQAVSDNGIGISGLLSEAQIVPLRVLPATGKNEAQKSNSSRQVARAIMDAVDTYEVDVITTSLDVIDTEELREAVAYAKEHNVIIVGAAGNSSSADSDGNDPYIYPAAYESVISVGAVDKDNAVRDNSQKNDQVFVTAPGENVALLDISRNARCTISSGTSYSSPIVAAMAAAAKQRMEEMSGSKTLMTVDQFKTALQASSVDAGEEGYDTSYGYGVVDLEAFAQRLDAGTDMAEAAVNKVNEDLTDLQAQLEAAQTAVETAQAAVDALGEDSTGEEIAAANEALAVAQNTVAELQAAIVEKESMLNEAVKAAYPSIAEEIAGLEEQNETLQQQLEDLNEQLATAQIIDITNYAVTIGGRLEYSQGYTGEEIRPEVAVVGVPAENYTVDYSNNVEVGEASVVITATGEKYSGTINGTFKISRADQPLDIKAALKKVRAKKLRKKAQTVSGAVKVTVPAQGKVTYKGNGTNAKSKKALKINAKTGKIRIKKGTKKGVYKMKVTVKAAGNAHYNSGSRTVTVTIRVK